MFRCQCSSETHEFNTLEAAILSNEYKRFYNLHRNCPGLNIIPIALTHQVNIKCTECNFMQTILSTNRKQRIQQEIFNLVSTNQKALYRKPIKVPPCNCNICKHQWRETSIEDPRGTRYTLIPLQCKARNAVYIVNCNLCHEKYVGMTTTTIRQRISQHISSILNRKDTSIAVHFNSANHNLSHFKVALLDTNIPSRLDLRMREGFWIRTLQTTTKGINRREEITNIIDFQILATINHYRHSKSCFPYCTFTTYNIETLQLKSYRRVLLPPARKRRKPAIAQPTD